jgi:hypothetical protein
MDPVIILRIHMGNTNSLVKGGKWKEMVVRGGAGEGNIWGSGGGGAGGVLAGDQEASVAGVACGWSHP